MAKAYQPFEADEVAPMIDLGDGVHLLELFWGPTYSFKDFALQLLGPMLDTVLTRRGERLTIIGATSGDTGSAAIAALRDRPAIDVVILHPKDRISDVQRRQMTTVDASNVHNIAIEGTFDDCQDLVKEMFADTAFRDSLHVSAVNSINFARIVAQVAYYVWAYLQLGSVTFDVAVPTGNFGNVYAAYVAKKMGIPIGQLVVANNANNGLTTLLTTGSMPIGEVIPTISPAMDVGVPSNFERLLFDIVGRDAQLLVQTMSDFRKRGVLHIPANEMSGVSALFRAMWMSDEAVAGYIGEVFRTSSRIVDPHTAIGLAAAQIRIGTTPVVAVGTAHPAKFPEAVHRATNATVGSPSGITALAGKEEHFSVLPNEVDAVKQHIRSVVS